MLGSWNHLRGEGQFRSYGQIKKYQRVDDYHAAKARKISIDHGRDQSNLLMGVLLFWFESI